VNTNTDTPRTNAAIMDDVSPVYEYVHARFARELERENAKLREEIAIRDRHWSEDKARLDWMERHANFIEVSHTDISATRAAIDEVRAMVP
jgi:hypothetical protein